MLSFLKNKKLRKKHDMDVFKFRVWPTQRTPKEQESSQLHTEQVIHSPRPRPNSSSTDSGLYGSPKEQGSNQFPTEQVIPLPSSQDCSQSQKRQANAAAGGLEEALWSQCSSANIPSTLRSLPPSVLPSSLRMRSP